MLDHISIPVRDFARAGRFYDAVLATIGLRRTKERSGAIGYGTEVGLPPEFWILEQHDPSAARSASRNATPLILCNWTTRTRSHPVRLTNSQAMLFLFARFIPSSTVLSSRWRTTNPSKCPASSRKVSHFRWR